MKIKLFGKELFEAKTSAGDILWGHASNAVKESKYLPDFYKDTGLGQIENAVLNDYIIMGTGSGGAVAVPKAKTSSKKKQEAPVKAPKLPTPKEVYELKMLHDETFKVNMEPKYVDQQISDFKDKLNLLGREEYDMRRGVEEVSSIVARMENRKKYATVKETFDQYPYTTTTRIADVVKANGHLKIGQVAQFVADMPKEAVEAMKTYNKGTQKLCGKDAVFYIIADKKDFQKSEKRRDPILLAQSPFGHFWQILGAWDEEMLLLESL
jgi:hypothetical protein